MGGMWTSRGKWEWAMHPKTEVSRVGLGTLGLSRCSGEAAGVQPVAGLHSAREGTGFQGLEAHPSSSEVRKTFYQGSRLTTRIYKGF